MRDNIECPDNGCFCPSCFSSRPNPALERLTEMFENSSGDIDEEIAIMRMGDPSIEEGSDAIFVGGLRNSLPNSECLLLSIIGKNDSYDGGEKTDRILKENGVNTKLMLDYFLAAGIQLHEEEIPFLTLIGRWENGKLAQGTSFLYDYENNQPVQIYSGEWNNSLPHGKGLLIEDVEDYIGNFEFGKKHGKGVQMTKIQEGGLRQQFVSGEWKEGEFHGFMTFYHNPKARDEIEFLEAEINKVEVEFYRGEKIGPAVEYQYKTIDSIRKFPSLGDGNDDFFMNEIDDFLENNEYSLDGILLTNRELVYKRREGDVDGLFVNHVSSEKIPSMNSYVPSIGLESLTGKTITATEDIINSKEHPDSIGSEVPVMPSHEMEKKWISDFSEYGVKDSDDRIIGWLKTENTLGKQSKIFAVFPDFSYYRGHVDKNLMPEGFGTFTFPGEFSNISGTWKKGEIVEGDIFLSNKIYYSGKFRKGKLSTKGDFFRHKKYRAISVQSISEKKLIMQEIVGRIGHDVNNKNLNFENWEKKLHSKLNAIKTFSESSLTSSKLHDLIQSDESNVLEFKSSVWATYRNDNGEQINNAKKNLKTEDSIVKTIAAFSNSEGGQLVIGVQDRPHKKVIGIEGDLQYSGGTKDFESFQNSLSEVIRKATKNEAIIGTSVIINIEEYEKGKHICIVDVKPKKWIWVDMKSIDGGKPAKEIFFVRAGPETKRLSPETAHDWRIENVE